MASTADIKSNLNTSVTQIWPLTLMLANCPRNTQNDMHSHVSFDSNIGKVHRTTVNSRDYTEPESTIMVQRNRNTVIKTFLVTDPRDILAIGIGVPMVVVT